MSDIEFDELAQMKVYPHPFTGEPKVYYTDNEFMYYEEVFEHLMEKGHKELPALGHPDYQLALLTEYSEDYDRAERVYLVARERLESGELHEFDPEAIANELELCEAVLPLDITYDLIDIERDFMVDPGRYSGPWEHCYPAEYDAREVGDVAVTADLKVNESEYRGLDEIKALLVEMGRVIEGEMQVALIPTDDSDYSDTEAPELEQSGANLPNWWGRQLKEIMLMHSPEVRNHVISENKQQQAQERQHETVRDQLMTSIGQLKAPVKDDSTLKPN